MPLDIHALNLKVAVLEERLRLADKALELLAEHKIARTAVTISVISFVVSLIVGLAHLFR